MKKLKVKNAKLKKKVEAVEAKAEQMEKTLPAEAYAVGRHLRISPTKVRGVLDLVRGETVAEGKRILRFSPKRGAELTLKVLNSAVANAKTKGQFDEKSWIVVEARADKGPLFRRKLDPKARGSWGMIKTPSTHLKIVIRHQPEAEAKSLGKKNEEMVNEKMRKSPTAAAVAGSRSSGKRRSHGS